MAAHTHNIETDEARMRWLTGWNSMMVTIWQERLAALGGIDTGALFNSLRSIEFKADGRMQSITITHQFLKYGIYVARGVGRGYSKGKSNTSTRLRSGQVLSSTLREKRPWLFGVYNKSVRRLVNFYKDSIGSEFVAMSKSLYHIGLEQK